MRILITTLLQVLVFSLFAQVKGNKKITTETYALDHVTSIDISLYAQVEIDMSGPEKMTITIDENLIHLIDREVVDGRLYLNQKEWINPSQDVIIKIGAPYLEMILQGTHETTVVKNINADQFTAMANVGKIELRGSADILNASGEVGEIDARSLDAPKVDVNLWGWGIIQLSDPTVIRGTVKEEGTVTYEGGTPEIKVRTSSGGMVKDRMTLAEVTNTTTKYIEIKLKNNSFKRLNAYVRGPKPDGKYFSYGFPMRAGQVKKERWTVGTKVFRKTNLGLKKLLVEIKESDEGGVVKLYN